MFFRHSRKPSDRRKPSNLVTYITPPASILPPCTAPTAPAAIDGGIIQAAAQQIAPCDLVKVEPAPQVTTYHFNLHTLRDIPKEGRIAQAVTAAAHAPAILCPSTVAHFAISIPNRAPAAIPLKSVMLTRTFDGGAGLTAALGVDTAGKPATIRLDTMPHCLIAGTTGSGKSVLLNSLITSLLFKHTPATMRLVMIDPKQVELSLYSGLPHLARPIATTPGGALEALQWAVDEMGRRYAEMAAAGVKEAGNMFPRLVIVIDELADLMLTSPHATEAAIVRLAQLGRAAGIHLLIATQRPTVNVITGLIKANIPARIALKCASVHDSITILDHKGAEALIGRGDALVRYPDNVTPVRMQSALTTAADVAATVSYWTSPAAIVA